MADEMGSTRQGVSHLHREPKPGVRAYQKLLLTLKVKSYLSVAWVRTSDYWDDIPGRQSMQLNFDLGRTRVFASNAVHILPAHLWPAGERVPLPAIFARLRGTAGSPHSCFACPRR